MLDYSRLPREFRYRTWHEEDEPTDWISMEGSAINLSGTPPGATEVQVQARRRGEPWGKIQRTISVTVEAPWYQDPLRIALAILASLLILGGLVALRVKSLTARNLLLESMVSQRTHRLNDALEAKDTYLKELHHRVKNNLQIMGDLMELQADQERLPVVQEALATGRLRLESIALIHKHLYLDATAREVNFADFIHEYAAHVQDGLVDERDHVQWDIQGDEVLFDIECAQSFGLLLNELVTNSLRHGRSTANPLCIGVHWDALPEDRIQLRYSDNGPGLPSSLDPATEAHSESSSYATSPDNLKAIWNSILKTVQLGNSTSAVRFATQNRRQGAAFHEKRIRHRATRILDHEQGAAHHDCRGRRRHR